MARVNETFESDIGTISRLDSRPSITMSISKKNKGNSLRIIEEIKRVVCQTSDRLHGEVNFGGTVETPG